MNALRAYWHGLLAYWYEQRWIVAEHEATAARLKAWNMRNAMRWHEEKHRAVNEDEARK